MSHIRIGSSNSPVRLVGISETECVCVCVTMTTNDEDQPTLPSPACCEDNVNVAAFKIHSRRSNPISKAENPEKKGGVYFPIYRNDLWGISRVSSVLGWEHFVAWILFDGWEWRRKAKSTDGRDVLTYSTITDWCIMGMKYSGPGEFIYLVKY